MPLLKISNYIICCGFVLCISTTAQAFTPKTIDVPMLGFTGHAFTTKTIDVPLMGFTGYTFAPKSIEVPLMGFTGFAFTPKTINVPTIGFTGYGTAAAGSYGYIGPQTPINTGLEGGTSINKGRLESLGMAKPDLLVLPQLNIANSSARWGSTVVLNSQQVQPAANGLCSVPLNYTVQNSGTGDAPAFTSILLSSSSTSRPLSQQWSGLTRGTSQSRAEQLLLRPGKNNLTLHLDQAGQVDELSKANNQARLLVIVNGVCQPASSLIKPQTVQR